MAIGWRINAPIEQPVFLASCPVRSSLGRLAICVSDSRNVDLAKLLLKNAQLHNISLSGLTKLKHSECAPGRLPACDSRSDRSSRRRRLVRARSFRRLAGSRVVGQRREACGGEGCCGGCRAGRFEGEGDWRLGEELFELAAGVHVGHACARVARGARAEAEAGRAGSRPVQAVTRRR